MHVPGTNPIDDNLLSACPDYPGFRMNRVLPDRLIHKDSLEAVGVNTNPYEFNRNSYLFETNLYEFETNLYEFKRNLYEFEANPYVFEINSYKSEINLNLSKPLTINH